MGTSKIAPHSVSLLAERDVFALQFVEGHTKVSVARAGLFGEETWLKLRFRDVAESLAEDGPKPRCEILVNPN